MSRKKIYLLISLLFLTIICSGSQTPQINDGVSLMNVLESVVSENHEPSDCDLLRRGAAAFNILPLNELASLLEKRGLDNGENKKLEVLEALVSYADKNFGFASYESIACRYAMAHHCIEFDWGKAVTMMATCENDVKELCKKYPKSRDLQLQRLAISADYLLLQQQHDADNPLHWKKIFELEKELEPYIEDGAKFTTYMVDACLYLSILQLKVNETRYYEYVNYLENQIFPKGHKLHGKQDGNDLFTNAEFFVEKAVEGSQKLWKEGDIRRVIVELKELDIKTQNEILDYDSIYNRFKDLQASATQYLPAGHILPVQIELQKWDLNTKYNRNLYEIRSSYPILHKVGSYYGTESEEYLNYLIRSIFQQMMIDLSQAEQIAEEYSKKVDTLFKDSVDLYALCQANLFSLMQTKAQTNTEAFHEYMNKITQYYAENHRPTWMSIAMGKWLADIYINELMQIEKGLQCYNLALNDTQQIVGNDSPLYAFTLSEFAECQSLSGNKSVLSEAAGNSKKAIKLFDRYGISNPREYRTLYYIQRGLGRYQDAIQSLRDGIHHCTHDKDILWNNYLQLILGNELLINPVLANNQDEIDRVFIKAINDFFQHEEVISGTFLEGYSCIGYYYIYKKKYAEAEHIYKRGIERFKQLSYELSKGYYNLVCDLYNLYANSLNDMNKAELFMKEYCEVIGKGDSSIDYELKMLWNQYYFNKNNNLSNPILRAKAFSNILKKYQQVASLTDENFSNHQELLIPILSELGDFSLFINELRSEVIDNSQTELIDDMVGITNLFNNIYEQMLPYCHEIIETWKNQDPNYLDKDETFTLYKTLANYYLTFACDTLQAEACYKTMTQSNNPIIRQDSYWDLAMLHFQQKRYGDAVQIMDRIKETIMQNPWVSNKMKAYFWNHLYNAYYRNQQFKEAIQPAQEYYKQRQQFIEQNFDFLTQKERESFLDNGGAGSDGIKLLVRMFPEELASDAYNAILTEKGLLLRASERVRRAIRESGDTELTTQLDSLDKLTALYKTTNTFKDWAHDKTEFDSTTVSILMQMETLERELNRKASKLLIEISTPKWERLQKELHNGDAAIEYIFSDTIIGALILLPQGKPQYISLTSNNELYNELRRIANDDAKVMAEKLYEKDILHLYERLWRPLECLIGNAKTIYFSPSGFLNDLAFAAFKCPDGTCLSDHYELHQMLSTGNLVSLNEKPSKAPVKSALLYGSVYYSPEQEQLAQLIERSNREQRKSNSMRGVVDEPFTYLSYTKEEVESVDNILKEKSVKTQILTGFMPTEETLHSVSGKSPDILHLSTHGFFIRDINEVKQNKFLARFPSMQFSSMQRSGLALVDANRAWEGASDIPEERDGIITSNEVALLDLTNTRLAALSACQTATGDYSQEGVYGLHRGFKQAGVKSILATLWNVDDKSTARLMELFYSHWLSGTSMQQSFSEAVNILRTEYQSPYYWAPFVLLDAEN